MLPAPEKLQKLQSWKDIAEYLGRDVRTVIRWEKDRGLPVRRVPGPGGRVTVCADPAEIDGWLVGHPNAGSVVPPGAGTSRRKIAIGTLILLGCIGGIAAILMIRGPGTRPGFRHPLRFSTATYRANAPTGLVAADFNGDGTLDLAIANSGDDSILILPGTGSGTFGPATKINEGKGPERIATGDFNSDGHVDLAVTNRTSGDIAVLLGDGKGSFRETFRWNAGGRSRWVSVADLNHDGKPDLVVGCSAAHKVGVLLGAGDGTFPSVETYDADGESAAIAVADFNLDGNIEFVVADYQIGSGNTVSIYQGVGDGTFRARNPFPTGFGPLGLASGDLNLDGRPDIVTADFQDSVSVLLATSQGFTSPRKYQAGKANGFVVIADLDDDGIPDVIVAGEHSNDVHLMFGDGKGEFGNPEILSTGKYPDAIALGDFNRDGKIDFAVGNTFGNSVSIFINQGTRK